MNDVVEYPSAWARALMPTAILACLEVEPLHGYAIAQALGGLGFGTPRGGSLYPALAKLEQAGWLETTWIEGDSGPGKKQYRLTPSGANQLQQERRALATLTTALSPSGALSTPRQAPPHT